MCRVQSVRESGSFMALEMRSKIRELIAAGRSDGEVLDYFAARYGDYILLEPRRRGFGLTAWLLPLAAVAAGAILLVLRSGRIRGARAPSAGGDGGLEPAAAASPGRVTVDGPAPRGAPGRLGEGQPSAGGASPRPNLSPADRERVERELRRYVT